MCVHCMTQFKFPKSIARDIIGFLNAPNVELVLQTKSIDINIYSIIPDRNLTYFIETAAELVRGTYEQYKSYLGDDIIADCFQLNEKEIDELRERYNRQYNGNTKTAVVYYIGINPIYIKPKETPNPKLLEVFIPIGTRTLEQLHYDILHVLTESKEDKTTHTVIMFKLSNIDELKYFIETTDEHITNVFVPLLEAKDLGLIDGFFSAQMVKYSPINSKMIQSIIENSPLKKISAIDKCGLFVLPLSTHPQYVTEIAEIVRTALSKIDGKCIVLIPYLNLDVIPREQIEDKPIQLKVEEKMTEPAEKNTLLEQELQILNISDTLKGTINNCRHNLRNLTYQYLSDKLELEDETSKLLKELVDVPDIENHTKELVSIDLNTLKVLKLAYELGTIKK